jgi:hypothetical protein
MAAGYGLFFTHETTSNLYDKPSKLNFQLSGALDASGSSALDAGLDLGIFLAKISSSSSTMC